MVHFNSKQLTLLCIFHCLITSSFPNVCMNYLFAILLTTLPVTLVTYMIQGKPVRIDWQVSDTSAAHHCVQQALKDMNLRSVHPLDVSEVAIKTQTGCINHPVLQYSSAPLCVLWMSLDMIIII